MSSYTFNFKETLKVFVSVFVLLAAIEAAFPCVLNYLAYDFRHIRQIPDLARQLREAEGKKILFLGNSMMRLGIDQDLMSQLMDKSRTGVSSVYVYPDGAGAYEWSHIYGHWFAGTQAKPDMLIIGFAENHLADQYHQRVERVAHFYSGPKDLASVIASETLRGEEKTTFVLSHLFSSYANREWLTDSLFNRIVPDYAEYRDRLKGKRIHTEKQNGKARHTHFNRLLAYAREQGTEVILVAMPRPAEYSITLDMDALDKIQPVQLVDCRRVPGISTEHFMDPFHLNTAGAKIFTRHLHEQFLGKRLYEKAS
jgi:hypothetical protein